MSYQDIQQLLSGIQASNEFYDTQSQKLLQEETLQSSEQEQKLTERKAGEGILSIKGAEALREGLDIKGYFKDKVNKLFNDAKDKLNEKITDKVDEIKQNLRNDVSENIPESDAIEAPTNIRTISDLANQSDDVLLEFKNQIGNTRPFEEFKGRINEVAQSDPERVLAQSKQDAASSAKQAVESRNAEPVSEEPTNIVSQEPEILGDTELQTFSSIIPKAAETVETATTTVSNLAERTMTSLNRFTSPELTGGLRGDSTLARALQIGKQAPEQITSQAEEAITSAQETATSALSNASEAATSVLSNATQAATEAATSAVSTATEAATTAVSTAGEALETAGASLLEDPVTAIGGALLLAIGFIVGKKPKDVTNPVQIPQLNVSKQFGI